MVEGVDAALERLPSKATVKSKEKRRKILATMEGKRDGAWERERRYVGARSSLGFRRPRANSIDGPNGTNIDCIHA
jgi:hypothetical protein